MADQSAYREAHENDLVPPRAAFDLMRVKLGQEGAATLLSGCIAAAATDRSERRTPRMTIGAALALLQEVERQTR